MAAAGDMVARIPAAWNYGAVEQALREASQRGERCIFEPQVGKVFDSPEEAFEFFNMYSWEVGFGIRYGRSRANASGRKSRQDIVCSCEGPPRPGAERSVRSGCQCMIRLLRNDNLSWFVSRFIAVHNHPLARSCAERRQWRSHNRIDQATRDLISHLRTNNVQISRVCSIVGSFHGADGYAPFSRQSIRSLCGRLAQESIEGDMRKTMQLFSGMKDTDPDLVIKLDLDEQDRVRTLFWCNGSSKRNYTCFGDVVTFDTTYRTNLYNLPFGLFVGVNHHFQSVIFGGVLLTEESTEAFEWTFRSFVEAMDGVAPQTILTDQCMAMKAAISSELKTTRHRWCKWHVLRKAKESLGALYSKNFGFKRQLHELLDEIVSIPEFESRWAMLIEEYNLHQNQFLERVYHNRRMWAKPYFTDTFCAGMTSTQRSESANHVLKTYIPRSAPMHLFVSQFNRMLADREAEEAREEHATNQIERALKFGVPIEAHAAQVYTRAMFERFSRELFKSGSFIAHLEGDEGAYRVTILNPEVQTDNGSQEFIVTSSPSGADWFCQCKYFEHCGMPCRHILRVLAQNGVRVIPEGLVLKRWSRQARAAVRDSARGVEGRAVDQAGMRSLAYAACMELVGLCTQTRQSFEVGIDFMSRAKEAISAMTVLPASGEREEVPVQDERRADNGGGGGDHVMHAPPRVRSRGRPKEGRFKSPIDDQPKKKRTRRISELSSAADGGGQADYRQTTLSKCRKCGSTNHYANKCPSSRVESPPKSKARFCRLCGDTGHYRSTCGRKSTYVAAK